MIRILIIGAAGRMGRRLVSLTAEAPDLTLTGAIEYSGCPLLGEDAGTVAGGASLGVALTDDIATAVADADVTIDFSTAATVLANACARCQPCNRAPRRSMYRKSGCHINEP